MNELDYYKVLQLDRTANITDIKRAYKRLSLKYHPVMVSYLYFCINMFTHPIINIDVQK